MANLKTWFNNLVTPFSAPATKLFSQQEPIPTADKPYGVGGTLFYDFQQPTISKIAPKNFPSLMAIYPPANRGPTT